ncbi:hypothetical protein OG778_36280 (plasmid) [Streptomyces sp. NBC_00184]|uniref:hypothetical protein n=1 Tax=unclassified Streptomyces TaxID=2593676 RepID=UPI002E2D5F15|nr:MULTISPECIES: hypothetical protein [unclassified Streptomyces]
MASSREISPIRPGEIAHPPRCSRAVDEERSPGFETARSRNAGAWFWTAPPTDGSSGSAARHDSRRAQALA